MIEPPKPSWKDSVRHIGNLILTVPLAAAAAGIVWKLSIWRVINQNLGFVALFITFGVLAVVFYALVEWYWNRPAELAKKLPMSSRVLRRRRKEFYDNLPK